MFNYMRYNRLNIGTPSADRRDSVGCYLRPESMSYNDFLMLFPTIEMQFSAQTRICLPASSYLFTSKTRIYCIGILRERSNRVVIGAITMSEFNVVFDHQHRRIGWARALCDASEHFTDVTRAACCGSCEKARSAGRRTSYSFATTICEKREGLRLYPL